MKFLKTLPIISFIVLITLLWAGVALNKSNHPDKLLEGEWEEVEWKYIKVDGHNKHDTLSQVTIEEVLKNEISKNLVIHKAERWTFKKGALLTLHKNGQKDVELKWRLKGRGHILKLIYENSKSTEYYKIHYLDKEKLILHFENDVHARGVIRIGFKRKTKLN